MGAWSLAVAAGIVFAYIAYDTSLPGALPPAIAFTGGGLVVGTEGLGWIDVSPHAASLHLLAAATLALVLFSDASRIDLRALRDGYACRRASRPAARLDRPVGWLVCSDDCSGRSTTATSTTH